jgi:hypothetical protein
MPQTVTDILPDVTNIPLDSRLSRRLQKKYLSFQPSILGQAIDLNTELAPDEIAKTKGLSGYFNYGWAKAADEIKKASEMGIKKVALRFIAAATRSYCDFEASLDKFETVLGKVQARVESYDIALIVDPFGLALTPEGQWGVKNKQGKLDIELTCNFLTEIGRRLSRQNVYGVVTLGRVSQEVQMTKKGILEGGGKTKIFSFSQNSETSTAYIYLDSVGHNTGQKILPGHAMEMDLWALFDIWHGTDVSIIKPMENYHLMRSLIDLLEYESARQKFLSSPAVQRLVMNDPFAQTLLEELCLNPDILKEKCRNVKLGGYTVSGTTYMLSLLATAKGPEMARSRLEELWITAFGILGEKCECLIDRNTMKYFSGSLLY